MTFYFWDEPRNARVGAALRCSNVWAGIIWSFTSFGCTKEKFSMPKRDAPQFFQLEMFHTVNSLVRNIQHSNLAFKKMAFLKTLRDKLQNFSLLLFGKNMVQWKKIWVFVAKKIIKYFFRLWQRGLFRKPLVLAEVRVLVTFSVIVGLFLVKRGLKRT